MKALRTVCAAAMIAVSLPFAISACAPTDTRRSTGAVVDDASITARVKTALARDPVAKATQVTVETHNGEVQLSGYVESQEAARRAVEVAREVPGVVRVRNDMRLRPTS